MITINALSDGGSLETKLTGLISNTKYSIEIAGVSALSGPGEFSELVTFRTHIELKSEDAYTFVHTATVHRY